MFIMAISEGSVVSIGTVIVMAGITAFIRNKAKADNADTMTKVGTKIAEDLKPVIKKIDDHEKDFKEFKKEEIEPLKVDVTNIKNEQSVMNKVLENITKTLDRNHEEMKELYKDQNKQNRSQFKDIWQTLSKKEDRK